MGEAKRCREARESRMVKIKFSGAVFTYFFEVHKRAFAINKGLPEGSELVDIQFDPVEKGGEATFRHKDFKPVPDGGDPPYVDVNYTAYEFLEEVKPEVPQ